MQQALLAVFPGTGGSGVHLSRSVKVELFTYCLCFIDLFSTYVQNYQNVCCYVLVIYYLASFVSFLY